MGGKLGTIFARAGHEVVFSYARTQKKLGGLAKDAVTYHVFIYSKRDPETESAGEDVTPPQ
jgi:hypothetical protein